jgi:hypothetical protein
VLYELKLAVLKKSIVVNMLRDETKQPATEEKYEGNRKTPQESLPHI